MSGHEYTRIYVGEKGMQECAQVKSIGLASGIFERVRERERVKSRMQGVSLLERGV
jgi:hypothetical protein